MPEPTTPSLDPPPTAMAADRVVPPSSVLLLVNPNARSGGNGVEPAVGTLREAGVAVRLETFSGPDEVEADILRGADCADCVLVAGGDGTVSRAGGVLARLGLPLGILPLGTANDLARTLGIPADPSEAARVILRGHRRRIDLATVNGHPFFNVASIGLSAELADTLSTDLKRRWGRLSYAMAGARVLARARRFAARITANGETVVVRTLQISVGNGRHYGGGNVVETDAAIDDGAFDLYSLELANVWKLALMLRTFRSGSHGAWSEVRTARSDAFDIATSKPRPVNVDGDLVTTTPARFRLHRDAVTVFAPPPVEVST
jgi:diacylglycerol kinase (ATP)